MTTLSSEAPACRPQGWLVPHPTILPLAARAGNEGVPPDAGCHTKGLMTMHTICFDIETGPLPETELAAMVPAFDPAEVKTGNLKDRDKVAAKIAEAEANHRREFIERAALDPLTGRVLAIGLLNWDTGECRPTRRSWSGWFRRCAVRPRPT